MSEEKPVSEIKEADPLESSETIVAANQFAKFTKQIREQAGVMNLRGLYRVLVAFAEFPYTEKEPIFQKKSEEGLFILLLANEQAKMKLAVAAKAHQNKVDDGVVTEILENSPLKIEEKNNEGENNGQE
jgi:hypothetical protein